MGIFTFHHDEQGNITTFAWVHPCTPVVALYPTWSLDDLNASRNILAEAFHEGASSLFRSQKIDLINPLLASFMLTAPGTPVAKQQIVLAARHQSIEMHGRNALTLSTAEMNKILIQIVQGNEVKAPFLLLYTQANISPTEHLPKNDHMDCQFI